MLVDVILPRRHDDALCVTGAEGEMQKNINRVLGVCACGHRAATATTAAAAVLVSSVLRCEWCPGNGKPGTAV